MLRPHQPVWLLAAFLAVAAVSHAAVADEHETTFQLHRGINLSHWFAQSGDYSPRHLRTHTTRDDIELIESLGFDHVRFTIEPALLWEREAEEEGAINAEYLGYLDEALDMMLGVGVNVVVDLHPSDDFKFPLRDDDDYVAGFAAFWRNLAEHLSDRDPERVALEVINEPRVEEPDRWQHVITTLAGAMREGAPDHTIIVGGYRWSGIDELLALEPLDDPNVIYTFHMYEPYDFSHQGATWGADHWRHLRGVPYPSSPEAVAGQLDDVADEAARNSLRHYGEQRWNAERIEARIAQAADWGEEHGVPLYCGEFGVYRRYADPEDRAEWTRDLIEALDERGIGWAMWDYKGGFTVLDPDADDPPAADPAIVEALGLD